MQPPPVDPSSTTITDINVNVATDTLSHEPDTLPPSPPVRADLLPESFLLSKDAELDWIDHNAFLERKDSTRTTTGSVHSINIHYHINHPNSLNPSSQRYSCSSSSTTKSNASIIVGLTKLTGKMTHHHHETKTNRRATTTTRFFPKKDAISSFSSSSGHRKLAGIITEPTSPKVSCIGRVRSRRLDRNRLNKKKKRQQKSTTETTTTTTVPEAVIKRSKSSRKGRKSGFWTSVRSIFHHREKKKSNRCGDASGGGGSEAVNSSRTTTVAGRSRMSGSVRRRGSLVTSSSNLGGMKRFSSGRRSESWWSEEEEEDVDSVVDDYGACKLDEQHECPGLGSMMKFASGRKSDGWMAGEVAKSQPLGPKTTIWERRRSKAAAQPSGVGVERRWEGLQVGPLSV